jgi:HEPN domain-containing protein
MREQAKAWVTFAREDLQVADLTFDAGLWNQPCFHAQQCVEKMLKAALTEQDVDVPRTHQLADLLGRVGRTVSDALDSVAHDIRSLDHFYVPTRYPDTLPGALPSGLPDREEASAALSTAHTVAGTIVELFPDTR